MVDFKIMELMRIFKPYLDYDKYDGELSKHKMGLVENAPEEAKKAFKKYVEFYEKAERDGVVV